jgi:hypothetical protein
LLVGYGGREGGYYQIVCVCFRSVGREVGLLPPRLAANNTPGEELFNSCCVYFVQICTAKQGFG